MFHTLTIPTLAILASAPGGLCAQAQPAQINVVPHTREIQYDTSRSFKDLKHEQVDTISPYSVGDLTRTQGLMSGVTRLKPEVTVGYRTYPGLGLSCAWYNTIDIGLYLEPTIFIAREVNRNSCMRRAVLEHEMKHVAVDRRLVNKYAKVMGDRVYALLQKNGVNSGPVAARDVKRIAEAMQKTVFAVLRAEFRALENEQRAEQQKIDTRAEYERVSRLCPGFRP